MTREELLALDAGAIPARAETLAPDDIRMLVGLLDEKADVPRYHALLLLKSRSGAKDDVYPYMDAFTGKLKSDNSYQRNIGAVLTAANARWDAEDRIDAAIDDYMALLNDEKPITIRQCVQALPDIIRHKPALRGIIADRLFTFDLSGVKETMRKSILVDILGVFAELRRHVKSDVIESYIGTALASGILDKKTIREIESLMKQG
jgi:hypothetical protein